MIHREITAVRVHAAMTSSYADIIVMLTVSAIGRGTIQEKSEKP
jgi:hypothetical protein